MRLPPRVRKARKILTIAAGGASLGLMSGGCFGPLGRTPYGVVIQDLPDGGQAEDAGPEDGGDDAGTPLGRVTNDGGS